MNHKVYKHRLIYILTMAKTKKQSVWMEEYNTVAGSYLKTSEGKEYTWISEKNRNEDGEWDKIWKAEDDCTYTQDEVEDELLSNLAEGEIDSEERNCYGVKRITFTILNE